LHGDPVGVGEVQLGPILSDARFYTQRGKLSRLPLNVEVLDSHAEVVDLTRRLDVIEAQEGITEP
jgi:hypothetical protein